jgi:hypothetical protein
MLASDEDREVYGIGPPPVSHEGVRAEKVRAPLGSRNCWWCVATIRLAVRRDPAEADRACTARVGASPMVVNCQDALRTRFTENWCKMVITGEHVKPLVWLRFWTFLQVSEVGWNGLLLRVLRGSSLRPRSEGTSCPAQIPGRGSVTSGIVADEATPRRPRAARICNPSRASGPGRTSLHAAMKRCFRCRRARRSSIPGL